MHEQRLSWWWIFGAAILFAVAHTQSPLFYSNQNQYFLHGFARAGVGDLATDWMSHTKDPTPVFSSGIAVAMQYLGTWPLHAAFFLLLLVYFVSVMAIIRKTPYAPTNRAGEFLLMGLLMLAHSGIIRVASVAVLGVDYPWYAQAGVANQYLIGPGLQPSAFGILLLAALALFVHQQWVATAMMIGLTCSIHSTYLLPAAMLVIGLMIQLAFIEQQRARALWFGGICLVLVLPVTLNAVFVFKPTDAATFAEGQRLIAWVRIPHHTDTARWLDVVAWVQLFWIAIGIRCYRSTRLEKPLLWASGLAIILSVIQVASHSASLALLFPWRLSTMLMPLSTAVIIAWCCRWLRGPRVAMAVGGFAGVVSVVGGIVVVMNGWGYQVSHAEDGLQDLVRTHRQPGDVYLIPTSFPKPPSKRGSSSSTFVPVPTNSRQTTFEMQRFRLMTGAAAYIDFKSIPYADREIIEWNRRVENCVRWYGTKEWDRSATVDELLAEGITHVILPTEETVRSTRLTFLFSNQGYSAYRIAP